MESSGKLGTPGALIMFDGPDGVGKSTQVALAYKSIQNKSLEVHSSRLSGGTPIGEALRQVSLNPELPRLPKTDLYIVLAMYSSLAHKLDILRAEGTICLVDRSPLSIMAYQVYGSGLSHEEGEKATAEALALFSPDVVICYYAPVELIEAHRKSRHDSQNSDYFEKQPYDFGLRVIDGYRDAAQIFHTEQIDASGSKNDVHDRTMKLIHEVIT